MTRHLWMDVALVLALVAGARCLRDVRLEVVPEAVQRGHEAILRCHYDLEDAPLYSLKWYRGTHEFYRFSPSETPATKIFNITGIDVDLTNSNDSQVMIRNVDFGLSGSFSCEVTADAPKFSTAFVSKTLTVVALPEGRPVIVSERERYDPGDVLRANCSSPPSRPSTRLSFTLNNVPVGQPSSKQFQRHLQKLDRNEAASGNGDTGPHWSELSITLEPFHYVNGQLNLRCIAEIPGIYSSTSEVQLGTGLREPVPERVTSENGCHPSGMASLTVVCMCAMHLMLR
ncbi:uncharacterized protein LOC105701344 [Orussus abietinus]|uniref:uncharacterized protein LOC105701344 n=1 Tax=Orussus abietinus TaxID=222816 RepID=UPI0006252AF9|nr:uncharacterized protein LOC105701344 [Orussus abietinus]XP_012283442.1 uncharacterized protein LOC105701344 [Orussus abietinus]